MLPASPSRSDGEGDRRRRWRGDMALTQSSVTPPPASLVPLPILRMGRQSGRAKIRRQEPRVDPGALEPRGPAAVDVAVVEEGAAGRLDGSAMMDRNVGREAGIDVHLAKKLVEGEPRNDPPQADAERAILVMDAHRDHRLLEARVADARHCQEELADEISRVFHRRPL